MCVLEARHDDTTRRATPDEGHDESYHISDQAPIRLRYRAGATISANIVGEGRAWLRSDQGVFLMYSKLRRPLRSVISGCKRRHDLSTAVDYIWFASTLSLPVFLASRACAGVIVLPVMWHACHSAHSRYPTSQHMRTPRRADPSLPFTRPFKSLSDQQKEFPWLVSLHT